MTDKRSVAPRRLSHGAGMMFLVHLRESATTVSAATLHSAATLQMSPVEFAFGDLRDAPLMIKFF